MKNARAKTPLIVGVVAVIALTVALAAEFTPRFVWNVTPSAPIGLYFVKSKSPAIGDFVLVKPSIHVKQLIEKRRYLPPDTPLIKRVAEVDGAQICRAGTEIFVNGVKLAEALTVDSFGRAMPQWGGCFTLQSDELFLLNDHKKSLDGRYFGATKATQIIGVAQPFLVWEWSE